MHCISHKWSNFSEIDFASVVKANSILNLANSTKNKSAGMGGGGHANESIFQTRSRLCLNNKKRQCQDKTAFETMGNLERS